MILEVQHDEKMDQDMFMHDVYDNFCRLQQVRRDI